MAGDSSTELAEDILDGADVADIGAVETTLLPSASGADGQFDIGLDLLQRRAYHYGFGTAVVGQNWRFVRCA